MKYELVTSDTKTIGGATLFRIRALVKLANANPGDLGGYIESEKNLSQTGDAWVSGDACVFGKARVYDDAHVYDDAWVCEDAHVSGKARVSGNARVCGKARVSDDAHVCGDSHVSGIEETKEDRYQDWH